MAALVLLLVVLLGAAARRRLRFAGQRWAEGAAADATLAEQDGTSSLLVALPALGCHFALQCDQADRILAARRDASPRPHAGAPLPVTIAQTATLVPRLRSTATAG